MEAASSRGLRAHLAQQPSARERRARPDPGWLAAQLPVSILRIGCMRSLLLSILLTAPAVMSHAANVSGRVTTPDGKPVVDAVVFVQSNDAQGGSSASTATMDQID